LGKSRYDLWGRGEIDSGFGCGNLRAGEHLEFVGLKYKN
jgi:hypothetical protein